MKTIALNHNPNAAARFKEVVKGQNIMTPNVLMIGRIGRFLVEITEGTGFRNDPIWGVTVVREDLEEQQHDLSKCCHSIHEVNEQLAALRVLKQGKV